MDQSIGPTHEYQRNNCKFRKSHFFMSVVSLGFLPFSGMAIYPTIRKNLALEISRCLRLTNPYPQQQNWVLQKNHLKRREYVREKCEFRLFFEIPWRRKSRKNTEKHWRLHKKKKKNKLQMNFSRLHNLETKIQKMLTITNLQNFALKTAKCFKVQFSSTFFGV